uniref:PQ loop repeat protein n=1 Tax=Megaviridae environmental sample TaxID=1737588 RepID=A0A5J6VKV6_9VIRU|nr:MAG: PQ loop repeat protein [Megaviridae environmental sample]
MSNKIITDILGYTSTVIFTILFIPQVYKTTITRSAKDLSFYFLIFSFVGCSIMIPYCIMLDLIPILISNCIMLVLNSYLIIFKLLENRGLINPVDNTNQDTIYI